MRYHDCPRDNGGDCTWCDQDERVDGRYATRGITDGTNPLNGMAPQARR